MVTQSATVFSAIADPTRRAILDSLRAGERSAGAIAGDYRVSRPAISKHLRVLREAGLVHERRESRLRLYSIRPAPLREVDHWIDGYRMLWAARLQDLRVAAEAAQRRTTSTPRSTR
jgi:DNA-binding transcriptional ArsR family regulator